ncbi:MAG: DNA repair protein RadA [Rickettsiales bacterium]|nr:DNA repair protein RadA [Rickettsiales bacterium]
MKNNSTYVCTNCGAVSHKWSGKCEACGEWNTIVEETSSFAASNPALLKKSKKSDGKTSEIEFFSLSEETEIKNRLTSGIEEFDRVLGGGLVEGSAILLGGEPGIGKSTLLLQTASLISNSGKQVVYITGEESTSQVSLRAKRLGLEKSNVKIANATNVNEILSTLKKQKPDVVIIDSIQTMFLPAVESAPGTVTQVRFSAHELISSCKKLDIALILVGHVTKDGQIAGPRVLEHMVDCVLYFEGEKGYNFRVVRAVKNRFGPAGEIGVFEMNEQGLKQVTNPSELFISGKQENVSGSVIFAGMEGSRPLLVEVQALIAPSFMASPRRAVVGWDSNRLAMIIAVLQTRCGIKLFDKEIYLNIAGGIKISEPAIDLAVCAAIISAVNDVPIKNDAVFFGEVGLSGEVRPVARTQARLKEAEKLGFNHAYLPDSKEKQTKLEIFEINHISKLISFLK